ncbi:replication factor C subunit 1-like isoform X1 [Varroa destructor]|uniref:Replication factor C subunit 1 n=1 Tax=Varroa destructor TaxID=109461 RepID=A0A7M7K242_VARDE|nr:replication factor C subunit 1-like isoform X1 [Varroa destructor]XP_022660511.1 replication factor C subunit 1-like isoform X1 [Varroa destructor]XP_022660513.1 replication factor C subunit 1-like isoform X1 [Varroa destructor]
MDIRKFFGATGSSKKVLSGGKAARKDHDSNEYTDKNTKGASINTEKKTPIKPGSSEKYRKLTTTTITTGKSVTKSSPTSKQSLRESKDLSNEETAKYEEGGNRRAKRLGKNGTSRAQVVHDISDSSESDNEVTMSTSQDSLSATPTKKPRKEAVSPADYFSNRTGLKEGHQPKELPIKLSYPGKLRESNRSPRERNGKSEKSLNHSDSSDVSENRKKGVTTEKRRVETYSKEQSTKRKRLHDNDEVSSEEAESKPRVPKERRKTEETAGRDRSNSTFKESEIKQTARRTIKTKKNRKQEDDEEAMEVDDDASTTVRSPKVTPMLKEARRSQGSNYMAYLNREPPRHLGERAHPPGSPNCLKGFVVVMTGVMDYVEKDEIKEVVERCGGRITGNVSGKTTHLIAGRDAGPAKISKAEAVGAQVVDELGWFDLVESKTDKVKAFAAKKIADPVEDLMRDLEDTEQQTPSNKAKIGDSMGSKVKFSKVETFGEASKKNDKNAIMAKEDEVVDHSLSDTNRQASGLMWVDKYMPVDTKHIIGQQGDKSNVAKLRQWLTKWSANEKPVFAGKFNRGTMDGSGMKAALLSGPPGVGKTTTAHLVAKELHLDVIELNASDTRSKRSLSEKVTTFLRNHTLAEGTNKRHVLVMDEVDGMAGNEDRGGVAELIHLIKTTKVPIICICNDRSHPKMRSLVHYCFDLRFYKPQPKQIQAALMSICFKEGYKVSPKILEEIVIASNQDIRQCIHNLNLYCALQKANTDAKPTAVGSSDKPDGAKGVMPIKDVRLGPFDAIKKLLVTSEGGGKMSLNERQSLFFNDYNAIPLFIQENYVQVTPEPKVSKIEHLWRLARASESICYGDTVEKVIRSNNAWALLPTQALFSAVIPSDEVRGNLRSMINFPRWFGQYSSSAKHRRQAQALHTHMSCRISADIFETAATYLPVITRKLIEPLIREGEAGVDKVMAVMSAYSLQRADMDAISELTTWGAATDRDRDPLQGVSSKVKAKLTRTLNKELMLPYATDDMIKAGGKKVKKEPKKGTKAVKEDTEATEGIEEEDEFADEDAIAAMDFM